MTLTGRAAAKRPDVDTLTPTVMQIVTHGTAIDSRGGKVRQTSGATRADVFGTVDPETGAYRSAANSLNETYRRELRLRRNGRPRKR